MTDTHDEPQYRQHYQADPSDITVREIAEEEEGLFSIRMPIASTGEVRNEGDEPLTRDEIGGMARQVNEGDVGVFLGHGQSDMITGERFGQTERLGNWRDAEIQTRENRDDEGDSDLLFASAEMMDPDTLPNIGPIRDALGTLKEQAKRGIGISSSIGWADDDDAPGGNDLMEASIVGIPADPRTVTQGSPAVAVARAAVDAGAEPEALVEAVRAAVMDPDAIGDTDQPTDHAMTDDDTEPEDTDAEQAADGADGDDTADEQDERQEVPEWAERLLELTTEIHESVRQDEDEDEDDEEEENETDEDEDDEDDEQSADAEQAAEVADLRDALDTLREGGIDVDDIELPQADADEETDRDAEDSSDADPNEDAAKAVLR